MPTLERIQASFHTGLDFYTGTINSLQQKFMFKTDQGEREIWVQNQRSRKPETFDFSGEMSSLLSARHEQDVGRRHLKRTSLWERHIRRTHRRVTGLEREPLLSHVLAPCRRIRSQSSTLQRSHDSGLPDADVGIRRTAV